MKHKHIGVLSIGHMLTDINQGALPAMLPFFITAYDLSYTAAAALVFVVNMSSSVVQPLFGLAADRFAKPWLLPIGLILAGLGLALTGHVYRYESLMALGVISGIGIAAYHPEAARLVNLAAAKNKGAAMGIFGVGGTLGFSLGPLVITTAMLQWGLGGTLVLIVPVTVMAVVVIQLMPGLAALGADRQLAQQNSSAGTLGENWSGFRRLALLVSTRSIIFFGLNVFIPIYWIDGLGQSQVAAAGALTVFTGSGIFGTMLGGRLADRAGGRKIVVIGMLGLALLLPFFLFVENVQLATLVLALAGLSLFITYSPTIVLGQGYLPNRIGLSSGVTLGLAVAIGGGATPFIGKIADVYGAWTALAFVSSLPVLPLLLALSLPAPQDEKATANIGKLAG